LIFAIWPLWLTFAIFNYWKQWPQVLKAFTGQIPFPPKSVYFWWMENKEVE